MTQPQETRKPNRFRITSIVIALLMVLSALPIMFHNPAQSTTVSTTGLTSYPNSDIAALWIRKNGSDPGYPFGGANVAPTYGMTYFGTDTVQIHTSYNLSERQDTNLFPAHGKQYVEITGTAAEMAVKATQLANEAITHPLIKGAWMDDFWPTSFSIAEMHTIYTNVHHEDGALGYPLTLGVVVYDHDYWAPSNGHYLSEYSTDFDIIHFWYYPGNYGLVYQDFVGYVDAVKDIHILFPTKEIWLGVYLHFYDYGGDNNSYPYDLTWSLMDADMWLIKQKIATHISILENFWIQHNAVTAGIVRDFMNEEYDMAYTTTWDVGTGAVNSYSGSIAIDALIYDCQNHASNDYQLTSDVFQNVTMSGMTGTHTKAWDRTTGEVVACVLGSGTATFTAEPQHTYRVLDWDMATVTYNANKYITTTTSWNNKEVLVNGNLVIDAALYVNNSIIRFGNYHYEDSMVNSTVPEYGLLFNQTNSSKLYMKDSCVEPLLRYFPYYINTGFTGSYPERVLSISNSTISCYYGRLFRTIGYNYLYDSTFYSPQPGEYASLGIRVDPVANNIIVIQRCTFYGWQSSGSWGIWFEPGYGFAQNCLFLGNTTIIGFSVGLFTDYIQTTGTLHKMNIYGTGLNSAPVSYALGTGDATNSHVLTVETRLRIHSTFALAGTFDDDDGFHVTSISVDANGYLDISAPYFTVGSSTAVTVLAPFPWTYQNSGLLFGLGMGLRMNGGVTDGAFYYAPELQSITNGRFSVSADHASLLIEGTMLYSKQVSGLINLIFVMLVLGVVGGIATDTANTLRRQKNLTPDQMIKSVINMVVYIVIGLALLGAAYTVVA